MIRKLALDPGEIVDVMILKPEGEDEVIAAFAIGSHANTPEDLEAVVVSLLTRFLVDATGHISLGDFAYALLQEAAIEHDEIMHLLIEDADKDRDQRDSN